MADSHQDIKELDIKIKELEAKLEALKVAHEQQVQHQDVHTVIDQILTEKEFALKKEVESKLSQQQLQLIKWSAGTGISVIAVVISIIRVFFM